MIKKQREKEFLFELERLYHNYYLVIETDGRYGIELVDTDLGDTDLTTKNIETHIDSLRVKTLETKMKYLLWQKSGRWLISKIPTGVLKYLSWRNIRISLAGHPRNNFSYWADIELGWRKLETRLGYKGIPRDMPYHIHEYKKRLVITVGPEKPVGIPEWLGKDHKSYGYKDEPE